MYLRWLWFMGFCVVAQPVLAKFTVCNQTLDVVNISIGRDVNNVFQTEGWWTIGTNQCANVIPDALQSRYIYVYAQDVFGQSILDGSVKMCISPRKFVIAGLEDCWQRGHVEVHFQEVDTGNKDRWTLFLNG